MDVTKKTALHSKGPKNLLRHECEWEDLGAIDPLWAILSDNQRKFGKWDLEEFLRTGNEEIASVLKTAEGLGRPLESGRALDFGCGVGRLSGALKSYFLECVGVDISSSMIRLAKQLSPLCEFLVNKDPHLDVFADEQFDFVYSNIVLQHQPGSAAVFSYISEFLRISKANGLVVFQLPHYIPVRYRLQLRRRAYRGLRLLGVSPTFLYCKLKLDPITMLAIREEEVISAVRAMGGKVWQVVQDTHGGPHIESRTYFISR